MLSAIVLSAGITMPCCLGLVLTANARLIPSEVRYDFSFTEAGHCRVQVWPLVPEQSILERPDKAPILRLWKVLLARKKEVLEKDSELITSPARAPRLRTITT